jgi:rhodanese-related sulfurtransferase
METHAMPGLKKVALMMLVGVAVGSVFFLPGRLRAEGAGGGYPMLSPAEARDLIGKHAGDRNFVLLDVRTQKEFEEERVQGAVEVDFLSKNFREEVAKLDRGKTYLVYCLTGNRSSQALRVMKEEGFRNVYHMDGGITRWKEAGLPTVK